MSMMNANAAATTAMTANEPLDFVLPEMGDADFSSEELAEDRDGFTMSFPRIKIPAGGVLQFELPTGDPQHPDYSPTLTGVILFNHASCAYWPEGDEYSDDVPPLCSSVDGKQGYGEPGGVCETCALSQFGSAANGRGKACKNMRVLYLLRSGEFMPLAINLSPTSISPFREFLNQGFVFRNICIVCFCLPTGSQSIMPKINPFTFRQINSFFCFTFVHHGCHQKAMSKHILLVKIIGIGIISKVEEHCTHHR